MTRAGGGVPPTTHTQRRRRIALEPGGGATHAAGRAGGHAGAASHAAFDDRVAGGPCAWGWAGEPRTVLLQPPGGGAFPVRLEGWVTVAQTKQALHTTWGCPPPSKQRLLLDGVELCDGQQMAAYDVKVGCTLVMLWRSVGGSAAARANMAVRRKRERKMIMDSLKVESDSDDEESFTVEERPACCVDIDPDLRDLMEYQFRTFNKHLMGAIEDPGEHQERLESLDEVFEKLLYRGFIAGKGFYPLGHSHVPPERVASRRSLVAADETEEESGSLSIPDRAKQLVDWPWFQNFIIGAIVVAGINVGVNTYLDCGDYQSCYSESYGKDMWRNNADISGWRADHDLPPTGVLQLGQNWTDVDCAAAGGCFESGSNGTNHCWAKGPMPECMSDETATDVSEALQFIDMIILGIFTLECVLKLTAEGKHPWRYFMSAWNSFDFVIVVACYMPAGDNMAVLRLLRLMRLLKLLHAVENLQIILSGLAAGLTSIGYILILLTLVFYLFAIVSWMWFGKNDPVHFQNLDVAMLTLFRMSTMEDWTDVMYVNMYGCLNYPYGSYCYDEQYCETAPGCTAENSTAYGYTAALFFIIFIVISGYVVMSLFIGVITTAMQTTSDDHAAAKKHRKQEAMKAEARAKLTEMEADGTLGRPSEDLMGDDSDDDDDDVRIKVPKRVHSEDPYIEKYLIVGDACYVVINTKLFGNAITGCILLAAVLIGAQTYKELDADYGHIMEALDFVILLIFTLEILLKLCAAGMKPWRFFQDPWNVFDFIVVAVCWMPMDSGQVAVLRLLRLLRVLKLFKAIRPLTIIMSGLAQGLSSIGYIALLMTLVFYVFAIVAIMFFRANDPVHFGSLHVTFVTLFRCSTFEDWTDVMYIAMLGCQKWHYGDFQYRCENNDAHGYVAAVFFLIFILLSALIMLNLVIGSICSSMSDAQEQYDMQSHRNGELDEIVRSTKKLGEEHGLPGINRSVALAWIGAFQMFDSASSALALEASIHKDDLGDVLEMIGEGNTLTTRSREHLMIRANHTLPIGLIDLSTFIQVIARDLMSARIRRYSEAMAHVLVHSAKGLAKLKTWDDAVDDLSETIDAFVVVKVNGVKVCTHCCSMPLKTGFLPDGHRCACCWFRWGKRRPSRSLARVRSGTRRYFLPRIVSSSLQACRAADYAMVWT
jgi:voltage-gated sodium channel